MASKAEAEGPAGSNAILAALAASAFSAGVTLFVSELLRIASAELRERVFAPRVTHRREQKRGEEVRGALPFPAWGFRHASRLTRDAVRRST